MYSDFSFQKTAISGIVGLLASTQTALEQSGAALDGDPLLFQTNNAWIASKASTVDVDHRITTIQHKCKDYDTSTQSTTTNFDKPSNAPFNQYLSNNVKDTDNRMFLHEKITTVDAKLA